MRAEIGETIEGRWVVFGSESGVHGHTLFVRDPLWKDARQAIVEEPRSAERRAFVQATLQWIDGSDHPHIVPAWFTQRLGGRPHLFTGYTSGLTLLDHLDGRSGEGAVLACAAQLAAALAHCHERGWVHGNLQPAACSVSAGAVKLGGFGLGAPVDPSVAALQPYLAPELWQPGARPSQAADIYAFGALLFHLLAGHPPFSTRWAVRKSWVRHLESSEGALDRLRSILGGRSSRPSQEFHELLSRRTLTPQQAATLMRGFHASVAPAFFADDVGTSARALVLECLAKVPTVRPRAEALVSRLTQLSRAAGGEPVVGTRQDPALREAWANDRAVGYAEMGQYDRAAELLDAFLSRHPRALYPWANRKLLEVREEPSRLFGVLSSFEFTLRQKATDADPGRLAEVLGHLNRDVLFLDGRVHSASFDRSGARVLLAGASSGGPVLWELGDRGGTRGALGGATGGADSAALVLDDTAALVHSGARIALVSVSGGPALWSKHFPPPVKAVEASPRGRRLAVGVPDRVLIFELDSGRLLEWVTLAPNATADQIAWAPDGGALACAIRDVVHVCSIAEPAPPVRLDVGGPVTALTYLDRHSLAVADGSRVPTLYGVREGKAIRSFVGHRKPVTCLASSPDGRRLLTGSADRTARLWDVSSGRKILQLGGYRSAVRAVAFAPDGARALVADDSGAVRAWDLAPGRPALFVDLCYDGSGERPSRVARNVRERTLMRHQRGHVGGIILGVLGARLDWTHGYGSAITAVAFGPEGRYVAAGRETTVHVSRIEGKAVHLDSARLEHSARIEDLAFAAPGGAVAVALGQRPSQAHPRPEVPPARLEVVDDPDRSFLIGVGGLTIGRAPSRDAVVRDKGVSRRHCAVVVRDGRYVVRDEGSANGIFVNSVRLWEAQLGHGDVLRVGETSFRFLLVDDDPGDDTTALLLVGDRAESVKWRDDEDEDTEEEELDGEAERFRAMRRANIGVIWDPSGQPRQVLSGHRGSLRSICLAADGSLLGTASEDGTVRLWDPATGGVLATLEPRTGRSPPGAATSLAISRDGTTVAAGYDDGAAQVWSRAGEEVIGVYGGHTRAVSAVAFSPDGRRLLTGSKDGTARVFNLRSFERIGRLQGHTGPITAVGFSADGRVLLTGSHDGTAKLWFLSSLREIHTIDVRGDGVTALAFSPDGKALLVGGADGSLQMWLMRWFWTFLEDALAVCEQILETPATPTIFWERHDGEDEVDYLLDMWGDVQRCAGAEELSSDLGSRLARARSRILHVLAAHMRAERSGGSRAPSGLGAWSDDRSPSTSLDADVLRAVAAVDGSLAEELASLLAGTP